jgi:hypothetical protein
MHIVWHYVSGERIGMLARSGAYHKTPRRGTSGNGWSEIPLMAAYRNFTDRRYCSVVTAYIGLRLFSGRRE